MRTIHLARKPLSEGSVTANVLEHGTGALHIEESRISTSDSLHGGAYAENPTPRGGHDVWSGNRKADSRVFQRGKEHAGEFKQPSGRWPANVILEHLPGCRCVGTRSVKTSGWKDTDAHKGGDGATQNFGASGITGRHYGSGGSEEMAAWDCVPGCPVAALDNQSGVLSTHGGGLRNSAKSKGVYGAYAGTEAPRVSIAKDKGGASRFFKQVGGKG